ncbi:MAG: AlpA family phage regulatory protein [Burkholderiaceae bacterium]|nr:AlpA family phage regulatory protein [Burkholderiaceae bacterium]
MPLAEVLHNVNQRKIVILRLKALQARIGLGRSAIYYLMDARHSLFDAHFPQSIKLGAHAVGWIESEVEAWLEYRATASRIGHQVGGQSK